MLAVVIGEAILRGFVSSHDCCREPSNFLSWNLWPKCRPQFGKYLTNKQRLFHIVFHPAAVNFLPCIKA